METSTGETKKLSDLRIGEYVLTLDQATGKLEYSEVILFLDRNTEERREFLRIHTLKGNVLTLTPSHMLLKGNLSSPETIFAENLQEDDVLLVKDSNNSLSVDIVSRIEPILLTGVYAPLTKTGTILVNSVAASCYAVVDSQSIAHWSFAPVRLIVNIQEGFGRMWHLIGKPMTGWELSHKSNYVPTNGEYWYAKILYRIAKYLIPSHLNDD